VQGPTDRILIWLSNDHASGYGGGRKKSITKKIRTISLLGWGLILTLVPQFIMWIVLAPLHVLLLSWDVSEDSFSNTMVTWSAYAGMTCIMISDIGVFVLIFAWIKSITKKIRTISLLGWGLILTLVPILILFFVLAPVPAIVCGIFSNPDTVIPWVDPWLTYAILACIAATNIGVFVLMAAGLRFLILLIFGKRHSNQDITLPPVRI
jgi:hypothetical protein